MEGYVIMAGQATATKVLIGRPNADGRPGPDAMEAFRNVGGIFVMARSRVWARRVYPGGKIGDIGGVEVPVEVNDPKYKGTLEFLKWGDSAVGAQLMEIRYLPMSNNLDYEFQTVIQKTPNPTPEQGLDHIQLTPGENKFSYEKDALKIKFLEVTHDNRDSISKNPDPMLKGYMFFELRDESKDKSFINQAEAAHSSQGVVIQMSNKPEELRNLFEVFAGFGVDFGEVNNLSLSSDIYTALLKYASYYPKDFDGQIAVFKKNLQDKFDYASSFKALDTEKEGIIGLIVAGKPTPVFTGIPEKGKKMIEWVIENFVTNNVYPQIKTFFGLCDKLK